MILAEFLENQFLSDLEGSWRPHAENVDIPIGILMVLRCPGPPRSRQNAEMPKNHQKHEITLNFIKYQKLSINLVKIMKLGGICANGVPRTIRIP